MGLCSSESTTTVKTAELSDYGKQMQGLFESVAIANLEKFGGYEITEKDGKYTITEKPPAELQYAIEKYGANSPEVEKLKDELHQKEIDKLAAQDEVEGNFVKDLNKFLKGDYSYTDEQYQQIDKYIAPVKDLILKTSDDLLNKYKEDKSLLTSSLDDLVTQIDKTGFDVTSALEAAGVQYEKSGATLMDTLKKVNDSSYNKAKFEFDLLSQKADEQAAVQASMLGLPPGSQAEHVASMKMKTDALKSIELSLAEKEAMGNLDIQKNVEAGKQQISLAKVQLAESQGGKKEDVSKMKFSLAQLFANKEEEALGTKGNALINLEQQKQNLLYGAGYGNLASQIQGGAAGLAALKANKANDIALQSSLLSPIAHLLDTEQQTAMANTTTKTKQKPSLLNTITDVIGAGASLASIPLGFGGGGGPSAKTSQPVAYAPATVPEFSMNTYQSNSNQPFLTF